MVIVYALKCNVNGRCYVGSTKSKLTKRFREHRCLLRNGKHSASQLQADWLQYGEDQFSFLELQSMFDESLETRRAAEVEWMEWFAIVGLLYNEHLISMRPSDEAIRKGVANAHLSPGNRWTPEVNEKRSLAQIGKPKGHGAKISATKRAKREQVMR